jgi:hypothetical protein
MYVCMHVCIAADAIVGGRIHVCFAVVLSATVPVTIRGLVGLSIGAKDVFFHWEHSQISRTFPLGARALTNW